MTEDAISQFKDYFSAWVVTPSSVNIAYLARYIDGNWSLWNCRLIFGPRILEKEEKWQIDTTNIRAGNIRLNIPSIESADSLIESAIKGILTLENLSFDLPNNSNGRSYYLSTTEYDPVFFSHLLKITPSKSESIGASHNLLFSIDEELRCGSVPFDGTSDLFSFLGFSENAFFSNSFIELIIQPPVDLNISSSDMNEGQLKLSLIKHPQFNPSLISIGLRCFPSPSIDRRIVISPNTITWTSDGEFERGDFLEDFPETVMVQAFVSVNGKVARRHVIHDRSRAINLRYHAHQFFDTNLKKLNEALASEKNSREFEKAVAIIFNILGFSASASIEPEAPDIILFSPRGRMLLVECTLHTHDIRTKAGKLHHRRTEIQEKIKADFPWVDVIAILVCNQQRMTITEDNFLTDNKIILYCKEDIRAALDRLQLLSDPDVMIDKSIEALAKNNKEIFDSKS